MKRKILLAMLFAFLAFGAAKAQNCQAFFMYYNSPGTTLVSFYDSSYASTGSITSYAWNFGDNSNDTAAYPVHTYNTTGVYGVVLTITTSTGCTSTYYDTVWVGNQPCLVGGTITYAGLVQTLTVQAFGGTAPYTFNWTNGGTGASIQALAPGNYCVLITDAIGCSFQTCYNVVPTSTCQAAYTYNNTLGSTQVYFTDSSSTSSGTITSYSWNFGDNSTGTGPNPIHSYNTFGSYGVALTITTSTGCSSTFWDTVWVGTQPCTLWAYSTYTQSNSTLSAQTSGGTPPYSYLWSPSTGLSNPTSAVTTVNVTSITTYGLLVTDANGCTYQAFTTVSPTYSDTICGTVFNDINGNGIQDSTESIGYGYIGIYGSGLQFTAYIDSTTGQFLAPVPPGTYTIYFCSFGQLTNFTVPSYDSGGCAYYNSIVISGGGIHCGYNFGLQYNQAFIEGDIFVDSNNNGLFDSNEAGVPYQSLNAGNYWGYTNQAGHYKITVLPGTYTVSFSPSGIYSGYSLSTVSSYNVTLANGASSYHNDFGIYVIPGSTNLSVTLVPHTTVTPGFPAWYNIYVNNVGANATAATLTFQYDAALSFLNSVPVQSSINTSTQTITWNLPSIAPGSSRNLYVRFTASTSISIGASTFEFVDVSAVTGIDVNLNNNFDSVHQVVTGSWDPNNKLVVSSNYSDPTYQVISSVNPNQSIDYTINFQNTGTASAVNISVLDDLSADIDANSFVLLGTSHNANVSRNANHLSFVFPNIMLADSNSNEPASHGFVNFRVNANSGLAAGHTILDKADIYFDFNAPVATNDANLILMNPLGIAELNRDASMYLSPNPSKDVFNLNFSLSQISDVKCSIKTVQGKTLETVLLKNLAAGKNTVQFNIANLAEGVYIVELNDGNKVRTIKEVKTK